MATPTHPNRLIAMLPRAARNRLLALCETVQLEMSAVLCEPGAAQRHVYFPTEGFISLVAMIEGSPGVEVGMVGCDGMLGAHLALGVAAAPLHALVQGPGSAWRVGTAAFRRELAQTPVLKHLLERYLYVQLTQLATSAACLRFHQIGPRLARWLLMTQDSAHSAQFRMTQEFLSYMLGVRRVGITLAAGELLSRGLIHYHRGNFEVVDRTGLEAAACGCYAAGRRSYADQLG